MPVHEDPTIEVDLEDAFVTEPGDFSSAAKIGRIMNLSDHMMDYGEIEDEGFTNGDGGFETIKGLPEGNPNFDSWAEGLTGSGAGDTVTAAPTFITNLGATLFGASPALSTGTKVLAAPAPTISLYKEDVSAQHAVGQQVAVDIGSGVYEVRNITDYTGDLITTGMKHSAIPATGAVILGGANVLWSDNPATHPTAVIKCIGNATSQNVRWLGVVADLSLSAGRTTDAQKLSWALTAADFSDLFPDSKQEPTIVRPTNNSCGYFSIAKEGVEQDYMRIYYGSVEVTFGATYEPEDDPHNCDVGVQGWQRQKVIPTVTFLIPIDSDPSAAPTAAGTGGLSLTESSWRAVKRNGTQNAFQIQLQWGTTPGGIFAMHHRSMYLVDWDGGEKLGNIPVQKLTFAWKNPAAYSGGTWDGTVPRCVMTQF
jgi:hypothetical protein